MYNTMLQRAAKLSLVLLDREEVYKTNCEDTCTWLYTAVR